jgi:hypothetical protein
MFVGSKFLISVIGRDALKPARYEERKLCSSRLNGPHHAQIINIKRKNKYIYINKHTDT